MDDSEISIYKQVFDTLDADGDGNITSDDLKSVLSSLGYKLTEDTIQAMVEEVDTDGDGILCWEEFIECVAGKPKFDRETAHMRRLFKTFDTDDTGFISADNIREILAEVDLEVGEERIEALIASMDADEDGQISYEEFVAMVEEGGRSNLVHQLTDEPQEATEEEEEG